MATVSTNPDWRNNALRARGARFTLTMAACNLARLPKLLAA